MESYEKINCNVFEKIIEPVIPFVTQEADKIKDDANKYTLSFGFFTFNLLYAVIMGIESISLLVTEIKTSEKAKKLNLVEASKSMYSEAFSRYSSSAYRSILYSLLEKLNFLGIPEINMLGRFYLVDGSIFPAIKSMSWAAYKKTANAVKLHLAFNLNCMIPAQFICSEANASEKGKLIETRMAT